MYLLPIKFYTQKLKNYLWHLPKSLLANLIYEFPTKGLILIGVTGTDGKTTTATLINQCLKNAGIRSDLITTINSPGLHTTSPDPLILQKLFRQFVRQGITHVVVETTAHGLDQFRFFGCHFKVGLITNVTHEHYDDFYNFDNYLIAKTNLFKHSDVKIFNRDDQSYASLSANFPNHLSYSIEKTSNYQAKKIVIDNKKLMFEVNHLKVISDSNYYYQTYNILAVLATIDSIGINPLILTKTVTVFPETKGRREVVRNNLHINTIVDFAHTPYALESTLSSLKKTTAGKLICIFGATGGRDKSKRPLMGEVVSKLCDVAIVTSDDTRNENVEDINTQIISGFDKSNSHFSYHNIINRQDAFNKALSLATSGDTIIACGKGHEASILLGKTEYPWSDFEAFRTSIRLKENGQI